MLTRDHQKIYLPHEINNVGITRFINALAQRPYSKEHYIHTQYLSKVHPFATLVLCISLKQFIEYQSKATCTKNICPYFSISLRNNDEGFNRILRETGFYDILNNQSPFTMSKVSLYDNHIPITILKTKEIIKESKQTGRSVGDILQCQADVFADLVAKVFPSDEFDYFQDRIFSFLSFCIREILRNSVEHGKCEDIYVSGNCYPSTDVVEIAIADEGIGVFASLKELHTIKSNQEALRLALLPGLSGKVLSQNKGPTANSWTNSGYGLYLTSKLCSINPKSFFILLSHGKGYRLQDDNLIEYNVDFHGTAVCMNIHFEKDLYYENVFQHILDEGERLANENGYIPHASSSSRNFTRPHPVKTF